MVGRGFITYGDDEGCVQIADGYGDNATMRRLYLVCFVRLLCGRMLSCQQGWSMQGLNCN